MVLIQMLCHYCSADDECDSCLGKSHADAALTWMNCSHCENMSLVTLCSQIAFFSESDSAPRTFPFSSSQEPVKKNSGAEDFSARRRASSCRLRSRVPRFHRTGSPPPSSSFSLTSIPLPPRETWSRFVGVTTSCSITAWH